MDRAQSPPSLCSAIKIKISIYIEFGDYTHSRVWKTANLTEIGEGDQADGGGDGVCGVDGEIDAAVSHGGAERGRESVGDEEPL